MVQLKGSISRKGAGRGREIRLGRGLARLLLAAPAVAQIPADGYPRYGPLGYPSLVRQTAPSERFQLFGDRQDSACRDEQPKDGIEARPVWERQAQDAIKAKRAGRWVWDRIRERARRDEAETRVNTHPVVWMAATHSAFRTYSRSRVSANRGRKATCPTRA